MTTKITLQCVAQGSKLRIRFHSYTNEEGKTFTNVYDNSYNCQFPRAIREVGRYYEIHPSDLILVGGENGKSPFYRVPKNNIKVLSREEGLRYEEAFRAGGAVSSTIPPTKKRGKKAAESACSVVAPTEDAVLPTTIFEVVECVICMSDVSSVIFIPCAHRCVCPGCFPGIQKSNNKCPLCRRTIVKTIINNDKSSTV